MSILVSPILKSSLITSCFQKLLKTAQIVPIFRANDRSNLNNYRRISMLLVFSKVFQGIVHKQIQNYIDNFDFSSPSQFRFRHFLATFRAVSYTLQHFYNNLYNGSVVFSIFFGSRKVFWLCGSWSLLKKLSRYGVKGIVSECYRTCLADTKKFTSLNGYSSRLF